MAYCAGIAARAGEVAPGRPGIGAARSDTKRRAPARSLAGHGRVVDARGRPAAGERHALAPARLHGPRPQTATPPGSGSAPVDPVRRPHGSGAAAAWFRRPEGAPGRPAASLTASLRLDTISTNCFRAAAREIHAHVASAAGRTTAPARYEAARRPRRHARLPPREPGRAPDLRPPLMPHPGRIRRPDRHPRIHRYPKCRVSPVARPAPGNDTGTTHEP